MADRAKRGREAGVGGTDHLDIMAICGHHDA